MSSMELRQKLKYQKLHNQRNLSEVVYVQKKHIVKLLLLVAIIIAIPFAFFQYIGQEPMREELKASGKMVVVNEDNGYQYEENEPLI